MFNLGVAEVRAVFTNSQEPVIVAAVVKNGWLCVGHTVQIKREGRIIQVFRVPNLRRFKEDILTCRRGQECGIDLNHERLRSVRESDTLEVPFTLRNAYILVRTRFSDIRQMINPIAAKVCAVFTNNRESGMTVLDYQDDDSLRFIQRVLESDAPEADRATAKDMVVSIRKRLRRDPIWRL